MRWRCKFCGKTTERPVGRSSGAAVAVSASLFVWALVVGLTVLEASWLLMLAPIFFVDTWIRDRRRKAVHRWRCPSCRRRELVPADAPAAGSGREGRGQGVEEAPVGVRLGAGDGPDVGAE
jgi:hypothetical protein